MIALDWFADIYFREIDFPGISSRLQLRLYATFPHPYHPAAYSVAAAAMVASYY